MLKLAPIALAALLLAGCGGSSHTTPYPPGVVSAYLAGCAQPQNTEQADLAVDTMCACSLSYLEARVPVAKFEVADALIAQGDTNYPAWLSAALASCKH
jgi:hypothetical protein